MGRILFFLLLGLAVYVGWRWWRVQQSRGQHSAKAAKRAAESMIRCDVCGLNLPESEALPALRNEAGRWYCCEEHRRQGERGP